jgi:hypothetical protein
VNVLQSNMLRQLVAASLQDFLAFFRRHAGVQALDAAQHTALWPCEAVFETELLASAGAGACAWGLDARGCASPPWVHAGLLSHPC